MKAAGIYRITIRRDGKPDGYYLGQAVNLRERWKQHGRALHAGRHDNVRMQRAFAKYGEGAFSFDVLLICRSDRETLVLYEQSILDFYRAEVGERRIFNVMRECVTSHLGVRRRPETIKRLAMAQTGRKLSAEQVAAMSARQLGVRPTPESRAKMSASHKARPRHPNSLAALQAARTDPARLEGLRRAVGGRPKIHSEETRQKIARAMTGRKQSPELIERRVGALRGRKQPPEEIAKRVASRLANAQARAQAGALA